MASALKFTARRRPAVLVAPAAPTPRELKRLSDIDDHHRMRFHIPVIHFYRRKESLSGMDPAVVIRDAITKALVHYYPLAGRLKELEGGKLAVDCTGEGVLFVEADADVRLGRFGDALLPPFPCIEELISDVPGSSAITDSPLLLFQVTRLACGGFILAMRMNHTMFDGQGLMQFLGAVAELARGVPEPTVRPVWHRELLEARDPPRPCFPHRELDNVPDANSITMPLDQMVCHTFFFGPKEVAALRAQLAPHLQKNAARFDIIMGCIWKCRTVALSPDPDQEMRMMFSVDARARHKENEVGIPTGYYGNAFATPVAISTARELCANYAVEMVKKAKDEVGMEYMRSMADATVLRNRTSDTSATCVYLVTDAVKANYGNLDYGWGKPVYGGPAEPSVGPMLPWLMNFVLPFKNAKGEDGAALPMYLPAPAVDKVVEEVDKLLRAPVSDAALQQTNVIMRSDLSKKNHEICSLNQRYFSNRTKQLY